MQKHRCHQPRQTRDVYCLISHTHRHVISMCDLCRPPALLAGRLTLLAMSTFRHHPPLLSAGEASDQLAELEEGAQYVVWWVGLGVLSSIGLGTGMHSGLLFLFPHMLKVRRRAKSLNVSRCRPQLQPSLCVCCGVHHDMFQHSLAG